LQDGEAVKAHSRGSPRTRHPRKSVSDVMHHGVVRVRAPAPAPLRGAILGDASRSVGAAFAATHGY